jgi:Nucleotidyltransferase domain
LDVGDRTFDAELQEAGTDQGDGLGPMPSAVAHELDTMRSVSTSEDFPYALKLTSASSQSDEPCESIGLSLSPQSPSSPVNVENAVGLDATRTSTAMESLEPTGTSVSPVFRASQSPVDHHGRAESQAPVTEATPLAAEGVYSKGRTVTSTVRSSLTRSSPAQAGRDRPLRSVSDIAPMLDVVPVSRSNDEDELHRRQRELRRSTQTPVSYLTMAKKVVVSRDDHDIRQTRSGSIDAFSTVKKVSISPSKAGVGSRLLRRIPPEAVAHLSLNSSFHRTRDQWEFCARSELGADSHSQDIRPMIQPHNETVKDEGGSKGDATTISSKRAKKEEEGLLTLREERDTYRDMCLTLGAEVSKLRNMLAALEGTGGFLYSPLEYPIGSGDGTHPATFHPQPAEFFHHSTRSFTPRSLAAMSEMGFHADMESHASDDVVVGLPGNDGVRNVSGSVTVAESDASVDLTLRGQVHQISLPTRELHDPVSMNGIQSRLARDILKFLDATNMQLRRQDTRRMKAIERMTRLVTAIWARAQVKLYGSHVTGLCLPSSDVDFVVCLPAVQKNAPAESPGVLEGRNAINESTQRTLARKLKSESWVDPRSMKLIERTAVPGKSFVESGSWFATSDSIGLFSHQGCYKRHKSTNFIPGYHL